jgi:hypothetical protein
MPSDTWEPPPRPSDRDIRHGSDRNDEPRNFETAHADRARNHDASFDRDLTPADAEDINTHGSER